jgi:hypothetical protein
VTLTATTVSTRYVEIVGVKTYTSDGFWYVSVRCSVTSDGDTGTVTLSGKLSDFFRVNYITMPGIVVVGGGGGGAF